MIIVAITGPTAQDARRQIQASRRFAALFELRLDLVRDADAAGLLRLSRKPCIATCRPVREGGAFRGSETKRLSVLCDAVRAGARYIDIELDAIEPFRDLCREARLSSALIVSHHRFAAGRVDVGALYRKLHRTGAEVVKFAYTATDAWQIDAAREFLRLAQQDGRKAIALAMGEAGEASRILYRVFGGWATYGAPEHGDGSAPGQLPARMLRTVFRAHRLTPTTRVYGLVGYPVRQSKGIYIHNPVYRSEGLDAVYVRFSVTDLRRFMRILGPYLSGCSVTLPHKQAMVRFCSSLTPAAASIGAVNTVVRNGSRWFGANTDAGAALDAIEERLRVRGRSVTILGAGGAARAIAVEAKRRGASVVVANRTTGKARTLARSLRVAWSPVSDVFLHAPEILVNATSLGMWPDNNQMPIPRFPAGVRLAFDAIYNPPLTAFLKKARSRGATIVSGSEMYERQAVEQIRLLTGRRPSAQAIRRLFRAAVQQ